MLNEARRKKAAAELEIAAIEAQRKAAAIAALPTKGKPASFFEPTP